jgi:hypothetical protein
MMNRISLILVALATFAFASPALAGHHEGKGKGQKGLEKSQQKMKEAKKQAGDAKEEAEEHAEEAREEAEERAEEAREEAEERAEKAREMGEGRGGEMRARRDERKAIMEEAKAGHEPGTPQKGKKPWWRFWESDDGESDDE